MAELVPIPFATLLRRMYYEYTKTRAIFDLPSRKFHAPAVDLDPAVTFCGNPAANPVGPAAGPHTQLAQNITLAWLAGARIIELKTVQIKDRLELTRPCIDMATIGYNTEWSQELRLEESAGEYVKARMIVEILKHWLFLDAPDVPHPASRFDTVFDVSVGYDLAGIQSPAIRSWLHGMTDASALIEKFRAEIPEEFRRYRDLPFPARISNSITLSTFHGTPAAEIERICEFLLADLGFHVVIKMNPPMLGQARLEHLLHEKLGYTDVAVNPKAYEVNIPFDDAVAVVKRLQAVGAKNGKTIGVKFGNTLEVFNNGKFLKDKVQYLSGQPLHILHLALVQAWRNAFDAAFPISFSAGVDANNFADCVSLGLVPITVCSDLLRPGGYGRLPNYLKNLEDRMTSAGAKSIDDFIISSAKQSGCADATRAASILHNTKLVLESSITNPRYHFSANHKPPKKIGSHLQLFDCVNCDKCIPVCPNDANFYFEIDPIETDYSNVELSSQGWKKIAGGSLAIKKQHQIGNYADACNECGNCDVFCPEDGGPYIEKPRFFGSVKAYREFHRLSGFVLQSDKHTHVLFGRFKDQEYELHRERDGGKAVFKSHAAQVTLQGNTHDILDAAGETHAVIDMRYYFVMNALLNGVLKSDRVHYVNAELMP